MSLSISTPNSFEIYSAIFGLPHFEFAVSFQRLAGSVPGMAPLALACLLGEMNRERLSSGSWNLRRVDCLIRCDSMVLPVYFHTKNNVGEVDDNSSSLGEKERLTLKWNLSRSLLTFNSLETRGD